MSNIKRIFFATKIQSDIVNNSLIPSLKIDFKEDNIAWIKPNQMHLTLFFFGDTSLQAINKIENSLNNSLKDFKPFDIHLKNIKIFGSKYKPQVIWLGVEDKSTFNNIFENVKKNLENIGVKKDRQNFVPHITLGRIKKINNLNIFQNNIQKYSNFTAEILNISNFTLFESQLFTKGAIHVPLKTFYLK